MIPIKDCKEGYLYHIEARNARYGIWREEQQCFEICREKFGNLRLDGEFHWDIGAPHGTAMPTDEIEKAPDFQNDDEKFEYLKNWRIKK